MSNWNREPEFTGRWLVFAILVLLAIAFYKEAQASPYGYSFPPRENSPYVTMDVYKVGAGGGTYKCPDVVTCYNYVKYAEDRGAIKYCKKIVIKRNGYPVITRDYEKRREYRNF